MNGTVTCDLDGNNDFDLTGGTFSLNSNGTFTFKMSNLEPNDSYSCTLNCEQGVGVDFENCGVTNSAGKTATNLSGFVVPPAGLCTGPTLVFEFVSGALCISGFGTGGTPSQ
jgi:hypothetical protein